MYPQGVGGPFDGGCGSERGKLRSGSPVLWINWVAVRLLLVRMTETFSKGSSLISL